MNLEFIGHCQEGTTDKVWCVIKIASEDKRQPTGYVWRISTYLKCWGRRGKKLCTQVKKYTEIKGGILHPGGIQDVPFDLQVEIRKKLDKGYMRIDKNKLNEVYSDFEADLKKTAVWAILSQ